MKNALSGLKVADFSWAIVGPSISKYLADFGATVVRVESAKRPCVLRTAAPFKDNVINVDRAGYFATLNSNKFSFGLNLDDPDGREIARRLINWADVVLESFRPGVMHSWGLAYEQVSSSKPDIIYLSTSTLGATGPDKDYGGIGFVLVSLGGFAHFTGYEGGEPMRLPHAYTDFVSPLFGASALISALSYRRRTGKGLFIDLSQLESSLYFLLPGILDFAVNQTEFQRLGNSSPEACPNNVYRCHGEDRWIAISVCADAQWHLLCQAMGNPSWANNSQYATFLGRKGSEKNLDAKIEQWTLNFSPEELMSKLQGLGVIAGVVQNARDILENPQIAERGYFWQLEHRELGTFPHCGQPFKLSKTPPEGVRPSPCLGEHTEYVCRELLNMSDEEFVSLLNKGVLE